MMSTASAGSGWKPGPQPPKLKTWLADLGWMAEDHEEQQDEGLAAAHKLLAEVKRQEEAQDRRRQGEAP